MTGTQKFFIDPAAFTHPVDSVKMTALHSFLLQDASRIWNLNQSYLYRYNGIDYNFMFAKSLIRRDRKEDRPGERFEIFNPALSPMGKGGYSTVYTSEGSVSFDDGFCRIKTTHPRVIKIQQHDTDYHLSAVYDEYEALRVANHLAVKPPICERDTSYLVMDKALGIPLETILHPDKSKTIAGQIPELTLQLRIELTFAILNAIKEQVTSRNLIHRDIKPANIIVDFSVSPPKVTIIDYGFALHNGTQDNRLLGTRAYRAPESFRKPGIYSFKTDVYSAGRVLSYLWGDDYKNYYISKKKWDYIKTRTTNEFLFSAPEVGFYLQDEDKESIRKCLRRMLEFQVFSRDSLDEAIEKFSLINFNKYIHLNQDGSDQKKELSVLEEIQLDTINDQLSALRIKEEKLRYYNENDAADVLDDLIYILAQRTEYLKTKQMPALLGKYKTMCLADIEKSRKELEAYTEVSWVLRELLSAICLLGVGYAIAVGVKYYCNGGFGLFSQNRTVQIVDDLHDAVSAMQIESFT